MGLLDQIWGATKGAVQPERNPWMGLLGDVWDNMDALDKASLAASPVPVVGDLAGLGNDIRHYYNEPESLTWGNAGLSAMGLLPFVPPVAGVMKNTSKVANDLPMDEASRMARAKEMGNTIPVYHASTHDINQFDLSRANPESDFGAAIYTTNSPYDASLNYSDLSGQDLTQKIQLRAERLADEMGLDYDHPDVIAAAQKELYGESPNVMPLLGRMDNPLRVGGKDSTWLEYDYPELDPKDFLDEAGGDMDVAYDLAQDARYMEEPEGQLTGLLDALRWNKYDVDASDAIAQISDLGMEGGARADDIIDILKSDANLFDVYGDSGALEGNELIRQVFQEAGFDGIIDSGVNKKWGTGSGRTNYMRGMDEDTKHYLFFNPNQLRSKFAKFDPNNKDSANLLASGLLGSIGLSGAYGLLGQDQYD